jgi:hypothetical protein
VSSEAWEIDGLAQEAAGLAHGLLCELILARARLGTDESRTIRLDRALERWPALASTMSSLEEAAPVSARDGRTDDEALLDMMERVQSRASYRPASQAPDIVNEAAAFATGIMADLLGAAASGADRARKRAFLTRAFASWPKLRRRMGRIVQARAEAEDIAPAAANPVRDAERLENAGGLR